MIKYKVKLNSKYFNDSGSFSYHQKQAVKKLLKESGDNTLTAFNDDAANNSNVNYIDLFGGYSFAGTVTLPKTVLERIEQCIQN